jgi:hypothetical protein
MNKMIIAFAVAAGAITSTMTMASAANVPCEEMLKDLRAAEASATLTAEQKAQVSDLETKGIERCNADDDKRADAFFAEAMAILGK